MLRWALVRAGYFDVSGFVSGGYCFDVFVGVSWYFGLLVLLLFWLLVLY